MERKKRLWVGGSGPDATLERASKAFRCLPASRLLAADLAGSGLGASTSATELAAKTVPAMGGDRLSNSSVLVKCARVGGLS